jgi:putative transposase
VLESLVHRRRDKVAAKPGSRKLLKGCRDIPRGSVTATLRSSAAAQREPLPGVEHCQHRYLNNRVEDSHQPMRQRERRMQEFKSPGHAPRVLSTYGPIRQHCRPRRHRLPAPAYRQELAPRFQLWQAITGMAMAAEGQGKGPSSPHDAW